MEKSAEQAIYVGVNTFIFIVALSISLTLMFNVRNMSELAIKIDQNTPTGGVIKTIDAKEKRIIKGSDVLAYYYNYIVPYYINENSEIGDVEKIYNHSNVYLKIESGSKEMYRLINNVKNDDFSLKEITDNLDINAKYELKIEKYYKNPDNELGNIIVNIKKI